MAVVAVLLALCSNLALAQFNKCTGKDGKVVYTDSACPSNTKGDARIKADTKGDARIKTDVPVVLPAIGSDRHVFVRWCVERWNNEASPQVRGGMAVELHRQAEAGGERVRENLRRAGLTVEQAVQQQIEEDVSSKFNSDCLQFGFRRVETSTDAYNERVNRALKQLLEKK